MRNAGILPSEANPRATSNGNHQVQWGRTQPGGSSTPHTLKLRSHKKSPEAVAPGLFLNKDLVRATSR